MRCITNTDNRPQGGDVELYVPVASGRVLLLCFVFIGNRQETESDERTGDSMVRLGFCLWLAARGFALSQRQATSRPAPAFSPLSAASFLGWKEWIYRGFTAASRHASQRKWFANSQAGPQGRGFGATFRAALGLARAGAVPQARGRCAARALGPLVPRPPRICLHANVWACKPRGLLPEAQRVAPAGALRGPRPVSPRGAHTLRATGPP